MRLFSYFDYHYDYDCDYHYDNHNQYQYQCHYHYDDYYDFYVVSKDRRRRTRLRAATAPIRSVVFIHYTTIQSNTIQHHRACGFGASAPRSGSGGTHNGGGGARRGPSHPRAATARRVGDTEPHGTRV